MSSSVMCMLRPAHSPRRLRSGFFGPPFFSFRKSTKSNTSFCLSGGQIAEFFDNLLFDGHKSLSGDLRLL